jgi:hypothetical protein
MNGALDRFEQSLVRASQELHRAHVPHHAHVPHRAHVPAIHTTCPSDQAASTRNLRRPLHTRLLRRRGSRILAGALVVGALAGAGAAVFGPTGNPREITSIECGRGIVESVTAEPLRECATLWPSIYHHPAPPLAAWVYETGGAVVVTPADQPPTGGGWRRLPRGWKADAAVLGLHVQLEDITTGFEAHRCWLAPVARALATSILRADGLGFWRVRVTVNRPNGAHPNCLTVAPITGSEPRTILLVEQRVQDPGDASSLVNTPSGPLDHARLTATEARVNDSLKADGRCATVAQATALWRADARAEGLTTARYVLFAQAPAKRPLARCARVLVNSPGGGGAADVYAADLR